MSESGMRYKPLLQIVLWIFGFLQALLVYWVILLVLLIPAFLSRGMAGVQGKLMHLANEGRPFESMTPDRVVNRIHQMWQAEFLLLAMTWGICSARRRLKERIAQLKAAI